MQDHDVNLICVEDGIDSSKDAGKLMISVLSAVAEIERENIRAQTTEENIYNVLLAFDDLYDTFDPMEKKQFFKSFIERIEIYPQKREDGTYLKELVFNFPIPSFNGGTGKEISLEYSDTLETVCCLCRR